MARCFLHKHDFSRRRCTRRTKKCPQETENRAHDFVAYMHEKMRGPHRNQHYILNMDQTPLLYCHPLKVVWASVGIKNIAIKVAENAQKRVTVAVTASGEMLPSMIIFKGKPGATVEKSLTTLPLGAVYAVQANSWMDERAMLLWVKYMLKPYVSGCPRHSIPLLLLDSYCCHLILSVIGKIQELGIEIAHIPPGCTGFCQPVDVGIGYPLKISCATSSRTGSWHATCLIQMKRRSPTPTEKWLPHGPSRHSRNLPRRPSKTRGVISLFRTLIMTKDQSTATTTFFWRDTLSQQPQEPDLTLTRAMALKTPTIARMTTTMTTATKMPMQICCSRLVARRVDLSAPLNPKKMMIYPHHRGSL
jgi:DDE superfamily endonuclease